MQNYKRIIYWPLTIFSQNETKHSLLLVNGHIKQFIYKQLSRPRNYSNSCSENPARFASEILLILWIFPHTLRTTKERAAALSFCGVDGTTEYKCIKLVFCILQPYRYYWVTKGKQTCTCISFRAVVFPPQNKCKDTHFFNFANHFPKNRPRTHIASPKRATATDKIIFRDFRF